MAKEEPKIRQFYVPSEKEKKLLKMVYDRHWAMKNAPDRKKMEKVWDKAMEQWEAHRPDREANAWQSNHYVPLTTAIVETALAEMEDQNSKPLILARSKEDEPKAQVMRRIYEFTWDVADGNNQSYDVKKDTIILGTSIAQEYYRQDIRKVKDLKIVKDKEKEVEELVYGYDDCMMEAVRLQDFFVDENARGFDGPYAARDCIRRYIMDIEDFKLYFQGDNDPLGNAKYVKPGGDINYYEFYKPPTGIDTSKQVEVLWYWSKSPEDWLIICANDVVVRMGPNPYKHKELPFARSLDIKRPHSFYGKGEPELLESIQDEMNTLRRMILDRNYLDIDKGFIVSDTLNLNDEDLIKRPHMLIPVTGGDADSVKAIEYGDIPRSVELSINNLNTDSIVVTGIDPRQASSPQPTTATQAALLKESALKKIRLKLKLFENEFLVRIARLRVANIIQYYAQPRLEKILGDASTQEYQQQLAELQTQGIAVTTKDGEAYQEEYRQIPVEGRNFVPKNGQLTEVAEPGLHFFDAMPEYFIPVSRGGFVIKFGAGPTIPLSKPLMQTKATEMYDRLIQLALAGVGYDPVKLGDLLLKVNDYDPSDFKATQQPQLPAQIPEQGQNPQVQQDALALAQEENNLMMQGQEVPPTGYATPEHTLEHIKFMHQEPFLSQADQNITQLFTNHVMGEIALQEQRGQATPQGQPNGAASTNGNIPSFQGQGQQVKTPQGGGMQNNMQGQINPALAQGGSFVPQT